MKLFNSPDDKSLLSLREFTKETLASIEFLPDDHVLEIGPNRASGAANSPVFSKLPETFFDLGERAKSEGFRYSDLDLDENVRSQYHGDISNKDLSLPRNYFDKVVCFSVLEHVFDIFSAVENLASILKRGGECHIITPWDLRFHRPRPDCWRISDDAYKLMLEPLFSQVEIRQISNKRRPLSPVGLYVIARK